MKRWRCTVCGYIHTGDTGIDACPNCSSPWSKFVPVAVDFEEVQMPYGQKLSYGTEVDVNPFFGSFTVIAPFVYNLPKGQRVKLHKHPRSDELFFVLKGRLKFRVGNREFVAVPGDAVKGTMNVPHCFENVGDEPAAFLSVKAPKPVTTVFVEEEVPAAAGAPEKTAVVEKPIAPVVMDKPTPVAAPIAPDVVVAPETPVKPETPTATPEPPAPRAYGR